MAASAGARAKLSSTSIVDEDAVAFAKRFDAYMANSKLFKDTISGAVEAAVGSIRTEVEDLKEEVVKLKSLLDTVTQKAIDNEQYSRRNNIRIFGIPEVQGEDCYEIILNLCQGKLNIVCTREELDRVHRVGKQNTAGEAGPRAIIAKLRGHSTKMKFMKSRKNLVEEKIYINEDLTRENLRLLKQCRKSCGESTKVYSIDGKIIVRGADDKIYRVKSMKDLLKFGLVDTLEEEDE